MKPAIIVYYQPHKWMDNTQEMRDLAKAGGYEPKEEFSFKKLHKENYLPETRLQELKVLIEEYAEKGRTLFLLMNEPVSIRYLRKFEALFDSDDIEVIDKAMLTMEIFAERASSPEIQLQIELAQIKYVQPRMRQEIGVSLRTEKQARDRGAGETAKDIMQSDLRRRVALMERKLEEMRQSHVFSDDTVPKLPILGYYSVGKTTLFNILTSSNRETSQDAFTTMILKSSWSRVTGYPVEIIDTIGLVDLPPAIIESFSLMLEYIFSSSLIIIALDASAPEEAFEEQARGLASYYSRFVKAKHEYRLLFMLTKCDLIDEEKYNTHVATLNRLVDEEHEFNCDFYSILGVRSDRPEYVQKRFVRHIDEMLGDDLQEFALNGLDPSELSKVYNHARIDKEEWEGSFANIKGVVPKQSFLENLGFLKEKLEENSI